jgi:hypothetical protein
MKFEEPHVPEDQRAAKERETAANMTERWLTFLVDCENNLPPVLFKALRGCFDPVDKRVTAFDLAAQLGSTLARLDSLSDGEQSQVRGCWSKAEDMWSQHSLSGFTPHPEEYEILLRQKDYIPPRLINNLRSIL